MRFGLSFPNFGPYAEPGVLVELARRAEAGGWDGFFVWDHVVVANRMPVADPWVTLGAIAQATDRITIGPMVAALPRHRPWIVARQAVSIDRLSGGRMVLGVGLGFPAREEFGTFGDPEGERVRADMLDESLAIIEGVWSGDSFGFDGSHYRVVETVFAPRPVQVPRIPIWVAAMLPNRRPLRRSARYDGVVPMRADGRPMTPADVATVKSYVSEHRDDGGSHEIVVVGGPESPAGYVEFEEAGLTWYVGGPDPEGEPVEESLDWVDAGPGAYVLS
jgi:alkanesulfonate monooxygenase SsuD/methylene tetrahydromethanopterin reductase-like flavin-dependent oxidoreductase (luciferase family)